MSVKFLDGADEGGEQEGELPCAGQRRGLLGHAGLQGL